AGFVLRRFAMTNAIVNITAENAASTLSAKPTEMSPAAEGKSSARRASTPYVSGLARMRKRIQREAPLSGNSAPETSQSGIMNKFTTAWNACDESMGHAIAKPSAVSENETSATVRTMSAKLWTVK